ncbi:MAG: formylglycine-generating enzyme family protein [Pseudanabaena sp.]|jgi:formylglycine-generating enzyme required for sulfatase activity
MPQVKLNLKPNPSKFKGDTRPVEQVSWHDVIEFCERLTKHTKRQYRLPTEAEWEYACRAGTTTLFHFGETISPELANYNSKETYGDGVTGEYRKETTPVDHFKIANVWGLCDMHGNVLEWCQDHWHSYYGAFADGSAWITDNSDAIRVIRSGSWNLERRSWGLSLCVPLRRQSRRSFRCSGISRVMFSDFLTF